MVDIGMQLRKSFTFMLKKNTPADAFVNMGPEINYWYKANGKYESDGNSVPYNVVVTDVHGTDFYTMYTRDVNRWLFGIGIGAGLKAPLGRNQHLTTEIRFVSGHTFLGKENSTYIPILEFNRPGKEENIDTFKTNLKTLSISVAYSFDFDVQQRRKGKSTLKKKMKRGG